VRERVRERERERERERDRERERERERERDAHPDRLSSLITCATCLCVRVPKNILGACGTLGTFFAVDFAAATAEVAPAALLDRVCLDAPDEELDRLDPVDEASGDGGVDSRLTRDGRSDRLFDVEAGSLKSSSSSSSSLSLSSSTLLMVERALLLPALCFLAVGGVSRSPDSSAVVCPSRAPAAEPAAPLPSVSVRSLRARFPLDDAVWPVGAVDADGVVAGCSPDVFSLSTSARWMASRFAASCFCHPNVAHLRVKGKRTS
jgi:hypothetical protein